MVVFCSGTGWYVPQIATSSCASTGSAYFFPSASGATTTVFCPSVLTVSNPYGETLAIDEEEYVRHAEYYELARQRGLMFRIRTEAEKRLAEERKREAAAHAAAEFERRKAADQRARDLLLANLSADQRASFERNRWFVVRGGNTGTHYRIHTRNVAGNIEVLKDDRAVARLCCHLAGGFPDHDHHLAQKLALQFDETFFLSQANRTAA